MRDATTPHPSFILPNLFWIDSMTFSERLRKLKHWITSKLLNFKAFGNALKSLSEPIKDIIKNKHRFVVIDLNTYKEKLSFELTAINLFVTLGIVTLVLIVLTIVIIAFTPLRELIPGYTNSEVVEQTYHNSLVIDSLEQEINRQNWYIATMQAVVGEKEMPSEEDVRKRVDSLSALGVSVTEYRRSQADSVLRAEVEQAESQTADNQKKVKK